MLEFEEWQHDVVDPSAKLQPSLVVRDSTGPAPAG